MQGFTSIQNTTPGSGEDLRPLWNMLRRHMQQQEEHIYWCSAADAAFCKYEMGTSQLCSNCSRTHIFTVSWFIEGRKSPLNSARMGNSWMLSQMSVHSFTTVPTCSGLIRYSCMRSRRCNDFDWRLTGQLKLSHRKCIGCPLRYDFVLPADRPIWKGIQRMHQSSNTSKSYTNIKINRERCYTYINIIERHIYMYNLCKSSTETLQDKLKSMKLFHFIFLYA